MVELKVYAEAFFEVALERKKVEEYRAEVESVLSVFDSNKELQQILVHPEIARDVKFSVLKELFEQKVSGDFLGLVNTILTKRRETALVSILHMFIDIVRDYNNGIIAQVYTPIALENDQEEKIKAKLGELLKKNVTLDVTIEPKLVAGLKIVADGTVLDVSISKQMANLKKNLMKEVV